MVTDNKTKEHMYELSMQGLNAKEIADQLGLDYDYTRQVIKRQRTKNGTSRDCGGNEKFTKSQKVTYTGVQTFEENIEIGNEEITPTYVMKLKGLSPSEWEVVSFTKNEWEQQTKDGDKIPLYQVKLVVRPRKNMALTIDEVDEWFNSKDFKLCKKEKPIKVNKEKLIAEIVCTDIHFGLLAWGEECGGQDWDLHISQEKFLQVIRDIVDRLKNEKLKQVYFCTLGDVLHVDNVQGTTTKGTIQQTDGRISKIFDFAFDTINEALDIVRELNIPINYVYVSGNHDTSMGYCLVRMLEVANKDINFDRSPNPYKAIHFGKVLIGLNHGEVPKAQKGQWLINDFRKEYGESEYVEIHSGHIHNEEVRRYSSILERSCIAQTGQSLWEYQMGFRSPRGMQCFIWHEDKGLQNIMYSNY